MSRINQLIDNLPDDIDCGIVMSDINRLYLSGFRSSAGILAVTREQAYLIIDFRYFEKAKREISGCEVILMDNAYRQLGALFAKHNCQNIAVENYKITLHEYNSLKSYFAGYTFIENTLFNDLIDNLRMVKTSQEIEKILAAQAITEAGFAHICGYIKAGVTEKQVAFELDNYMRTHGADDLAFETIAVSGANSSSPHGTPTDKSLCDGDFLTMDFGAKLDGYHSDMTRTVAIGKPTDAQIRLYNTVLTGQCMALDFIAAGQTGIESDKLVRDYFDSQGYPGAFGHSLGHGVGLEIHENPNLSPKSSIVLQKGMVVTVEPGLYLSGKYGVRIEDMVVVTSNGCENLTNCKKELICL